MLDIRTQEHLPHNSQIINHKKKKKKNSKYQSPKAGSVVVMTLRCNRIVLGGLVGFWGLGYAVQFCGKEEINQGGITVCQGILCGAAYRRSIGVDSM